MASIFDKAKKLATKISDEMNKGKWDSNVVNTALFNYDDPYKNKASGGAGTSTAAEAETTAKPAAAASGTASVQPAPEIPQAQSAPIQTASVSVQPAVPAEKPQEASAQDSAGASGYVKPVFRSRFGGPGYATSKVIKEDGLVSLSDLPVVDQAQSISSIKTITIDDVIAPQAEAETAVIVNQEAITEDKQAEVTETVPAEAVAAEVPAREVRSEPEAGATAETAIETSRCYYVLITHTKTYPAVGSRVMMRLCDNEYVWTDSLSEDLKPEFGKCPRCGKEVAYTQTEMD